MSVIPYLRLCRADAALIAFCSYLVGAQLAGGTDLYDVIIAAAVTLISTNFIYSLNSWADWSIDRINKPGRPIPSGKIRPEHAFIYSLVLLILSVVYPFFVFESHFTLLLFLLLPALGLAYSARPFRIRRYPSPAIVIICLGLITPIVLGYFMNTSDTSLIPFFVAIFLYCLSVVPLKEIEEVEEDKRSGYHNLYARFGERILIYSLCGLSLVLFVVLFFEIDYVLKVCMLIFTVSSMGCIVICARVIKKLQRLYQTVIHLVIIEGMLFYIILKLI